MQLQGQALLGAPTFVDQLKPYLTSRRRHQEVPRAQRLLDRPSLESLLPQDHNSGKATRNFRIRQAHLKHGYTLTEIARHLELHYTTVSKVVNESES